MRCEACLLLGPTGAGKTPLGDWLGQNGLWGRAWAHFDFGANLREVDALGPDSGLSDADLSVVGASLRGGVLLEDAQFHVAAAILERFTIARQLPSETGLIMNGLPRHVGQARDVASLVTIRDVICLDCDAATVHERIASDSGGDRAGRVDDARAAVARKLEIYAARTEPLVAHYEDQGVRVHRVHVTVRLRPDEMARQLADAKD